MKRITAVFMLVLGVTLAMPYVAFAHVVVTPDQTGVGDRVTFNVSVPNERETAVTRLKVDIPAGVTDVMPNVMAGWTIETDKAGDNVTAITWTGTIPAGQRADFGFKAQVPAKAGEINWKAYQTYADGMTVNWDQKPDAKEGADETSGPFSVTRVTDDIDQDGSTTHSSTDPIKTTLALVFSAVALGLSVLSFLWRRRR
jgi:uncharacterized protein YcnI